MSYELVNRITIKKDGVYISSHSNNDTSPFYSHRIDHLSKIYFDEGELALDTALVKLISDNCELRGDHPSVERFRKVFESDAFEKLRKMRDEKIETRFAELPECVRTEIECLRAKTEEAITFFDFEKDVDYQFCLAAAKLLPPRKQVSIKDLNEFYIIENDEDKAYGVSYLWWGERDVENGKVVPAPKVEMYKNRFWVSDKTTEKDLDDFEEVAVNYSENKLLTDMLEAINQHMGWWMQAPLTERQAQSIPQYSFAQMIDVLKAGFDAPRAIFI